MKFARAVRSSTLLLVVAGTLGCGSTPPPVPTPKPRLGKVASCTSRDGARDCYCGTCGCWSAATTCGCDNSNGELSCSPTVRR
jgi:hypothetical protein